MRAVGPGVLTPWQATILHELFKRTLARLTGGRVVRQSRTLLAERLRQAVGDEVSAQAVKAHLAMMSDRYLATTGVQRMAEHLQMLQALGTWSPSCSSTPTWARPTWSSSRATSRGSSR
jgi:UTP:GlnB (protein PII) uridylyltransferase